MPLHDFTFHLIISTLENETQLGRVLFYPEVSDLDVAETTFARRSGN